MMPKDGRRIPRSHFLRYRLKLVAYAWHFNTWEVEAAGSDHEFKVNLGDIAGKRQ